MSYEPHDAPDPMRRDFRVLVLAIAAAALLCVGLDVGAFVYVVMGGARPPVGATCCNPAIEATPQPPWQPDPALGRPFLPLLLSNESVQGG